MPFNVQKVRLQIANQSEKVLVKEVRPLIETDFKSKKKMFLQEFDNHPVTEELNAGPEAFSSIPGAAETGGNLYSLLGFDRSQNPVKALRKFLDENIKLGRTKKGVLRGNKIIFETPVNSPSTTEVNAAVSLDPDSSLEWTNRSFTDLIARGVSGLSYYFFNIAKKPKNSRSGTAIQVKNKLRTTSARPIPYITPLLKYFQRLINPQK